MTRNEVEAFVEALDNVQQSEAFGYTFYFVGDDHRLPFVTIADADQEFDHVSNLDREGVFRINIGVSRATFAALFPDPSPETVDHTELDRFLPHPDYAKQSFLCILSPTSRNAAATRRLIVEAHSIAAARLRRTRDGREEPGNPALTE